MILDDFQNPAAVAAEFDNMTVLSAPLFDWALPESKRKDHLWASISKSIMSDLVLKNIPFSGRGAVGFPVEDGGFTITDYEPLPITPTRSFTGKELRNLEYAKGNQDMKRELVAQWYSHFSNILRLTVQEMISAFLYGGGTMAVSVSTPTGIVAESFAFGTIPSVTTSLAWDNASATISDVIKDLRDMKHQIINGPGRYGKVVEFVAGNDAYEALVDLVNSYTSTAENRLEGIEIGADSITVFGYKIWNMPVTSVQYAADGTQTTRAIVDPDIVYGLAMDHTNGLFYCALDRVDGQKNSRLALNEYTKNNGRTLEIEGESKPFPLFDVYSWVYCDVMT